MEIRHPILSILIILGVITYLIITKSKKKKQKNGSKIANTNYIKNTTYYKKLKRKYILYKGICLTLFIIAIISSSLLLGRINKTEKTISEKYNRDIILCMDVSASVDDLNIEIIENLKETVQALKGERFGVSIFNTTSILATPLTDDYEYVLEVLNKIEESIKANDFRKYGGYIGDDFYYVRNYVYSGTLEESTNRGSSLIGDGLASCTYSFPNIKTQRSRIIILSTDNDLAGQPIVTLKQASEIAKERKIKLFGIGTSLIKKEDQELLKEAVEITGGKYYSQSSNNVSNIIQDIEKTTKTSLKKHNIVKKQDIPNIPFSILFLSSIGIILISKKVER